MGEVSQAGAVVKHQGMGSWWSSQPREEWPDDDDFQQFINESWDKDYGDRRQEIVFIGLKSDMDQQTICQWLDECLIQNYLDNPKQYQLLNDPFPAWFEISDDEVEKNERGQ